MSLPSLRCPSLLLTPFPGEREAGTPDGVRFSSDGRLLVVASQEGELAVYEVSSWRERWRRKTDVNLFLWMQIHPSLPRVYADGRGWDLETGEEVEPEVLYSHGWRAVHGDRQGVLIFREGQEEPVVTLLPEVLVETLVFFPDGQRVLTEGPDQTLILWSLPSGERLETVPAGGRIARLELSADGRHLLLSRHAPRGWDMVLLRTQDWQLVEELWDTDHYLTGAAWSPDGRLFALIRSLRTGSQNGHVSLHEGAPETVPALDSVEDIDWSSFDCRRDGGRLRDLLLAHERTHGVQPIHHQVSERLRSRLLLVHPFGHDDKIVDWGTSPDGQWLATGSWSSETYERGGVLQIWEVATGRVVNRVRVRGGVGWPEYKAIEWSPDGRWVALAHDTNGVGVWDPFGASPEPWADAYVTDGGSRPPWFSWSRDGRRIFVENNGGGCWLPVDRTGDLAKVAVEGPEDADDSAEIPPAPPCPWPRPEVGGHTVRFSHAGTFVDIEPSEPSPLLDADEDLGLAFPIHPAFPVNDEEGEERWGLAFEEGAVVLPPGVDAERYLAFSLAHRWSWPLRWVPGVARAASLPELARDERALLPHFVRERFRDKPAPDSSSWPPARGTGHHDLVELAVQTLLGLQGWGSHRDEYLIQVAVSEVIQGNLAQAHQILGHLTDEWRPVGLAKLAYHCAMRREPEARQQAEDYVVEAVSRLPSVNKYRICHVHTYLAGAYHGLGWPAQCREQLALATPLAHPETNSGQYTWPLLGIRVLAGQGEGWAEQGVRWGLSGHSIFCREVVNDLARYCELDALLAFQRQAAAHNLVGEIDLIEPIARVAPLERLGDCVASFHGESYAQRLISASFEKAERGGHPGLGQALAHWLPQPKQRDDWLRWLGVASRVAPELARGCVQGRDWSLEDVASWAYLRDAPRLYHALGQVLARLGLELDASALPAAHAAALQTGVASQLGPADCDAQLRALEPDLPGEGKPLWHLVAVASAQAGSPDSKRWLREAVRRSGGSDLVLEELVTRLAEAGQLESAYRAWMKIPVGTRRYRLRPLLAKVRELRAYDALYDLLVSLDPTDLNDRGQHAVSVLNGLAGCGEHQI